MRRRRHRVLRVLLIGTLLASVGACDEESGESAPTTTVAVCAANGLADDHHEVDLDGVAPAEIVYLRSIARGGPGGSGVWELGVCADGDLLGQVKLVGEDVEILGFVDLGNRGSMEILVSDPGDRGRRVRAATVTARGLTLTDLAAEVWFAGDPSAGPSAPFEAAGLECADVDDDGLTDLVTTEYRPAEDLVHVGVAKVVLEGTTTTVVGVDAYETSVESAFARWRAPDRCAPGSAAPVGVEVGKNGWARVRLGDAFDSDGSVVLTGIAFDESQGRYVVVGTERPAMVIGEPFEPRPTSWWSTDAIHWERADLGDGTGELRDVVTRTDGGFVAVGATNAGTAAVWQSADGASWQLVEVRAAGVDQGPARAVMSAVTTAEDGFVAVGTEEYASEPGGPAPDLDAAVWRSSDGSTWKRVQAPPLGTIGYQPNDGVEFNGELVGVAHQSGGGVVAVGSASDPTDTTLDFPVGLPTAWVSPDGQRWTRHDIDADVRLRGVVATTAGLFSFGVSSLSGRPDQDGVILGSTDGQTWQGIDGPFGGLAESDGSQMINAVVEVPSHGVLAVGNDEQEFEGIGAAAVWWAASSEPTAWRREAHDDRVFEALDLAPTATMTDVAATQNQVVVAGFASRPVPLPSGGTACCVAVPAIWIWTPSA